MADVQSVSNGSPESSISFSFLHFMKFLKDNNVFAIAVAAVLSERISDLINASIESLIMPIINRDADEDGVKDIQRLEEHTVIIGGMTFTVGKLLTSFIKFVIVTYIVFIVSKGFRNAAKTMGVNLVKKKWLLLNHRLIQQ